MGALAEKCVYFVCFGASALRIRWAVNPNWDSWETVKTFGSALNEYCCWMDIQPVLKFSLHLVPYRCKNATYCMKSVLSLNYLLTIVIRACSIPWPRHTFNSEGVAVLLHDKYSRRWSAKWLFFFTPKVVILSGAEMVKVVPGKSVVNSKQGWANFI